jgi:hypothetical protein
VYVFAVPEAGDVPRAGRVLKVGRAGPRSNARFQSHHYGLDRAPSTLAATLLRRKNLWSALGIEHIGPATVSSWMKRRLDRYHFFVSESDCPVLLAPAKSTSSRCWTRCSRGRRSSAASTQSRGPRTPKPRWLVRAPVRRRPCGAISGLP